jgi:hypothetical protein
MKCLQGRKQLPRTERSQRVGARKEMGGGSHWRGLETGLWVGRYRPGRGNDLEHCTVQGILAVPRWDN